MCGRFTQTKSHAEVLEALGEIELPPLFCGRYNIAPTQPVAVIRQDMPTRAEECIWGFEHPHSRAPIINARCETLDVRPMFKNLLSLNRCLIPADGFYEWKGKQPYYFQLPDKQLFAFGGLWHNGRCTIITRTTDSNMQDIHDRMPLILPFCHWNSWLERFHLPEPPQLIARPVSRRVNKVANDDPACLDPAEVQADLSLFPDKD
jgi:putative SOS response-associated peptidase YedK